MIRRTAHSMRFLRSIWFAAVCLLPASVRGQPASHELRVITYNVKSASGYGTADGMTATARFRLMGEEIATYHPDVFVLQEPGFRADLYDTLVAAMGSNYRYYVLKCPDDQERKRVGLLVVNTAVIVDSIDHCIQGDDPEAGLLFNHWACASLTFQGFSLVVYGFKLAPRDRAKTRRRQIDLLTPYLRKDVAQARAVIVAADLNHRPFDPEYDRWMSLGLVDAFDSLARGDGFTKMDELGDDPLVPYRRIDYLLLSTTLAQRQDHSSRVLHENFFVPDPPHRRWSLSDHLPVMAVFSIP